MAENKKLSEAQANPAPETPPTTTSKQWRIDLSDVLRSAEFAVIGTVVGIIKTSVDAGSLNFNWPEIGKFALIAGLSSIINSWYSIQKIIIKN